MERLRILYDDRYADVRLQYRRRLERNVNGIAIFGGLWVFLLTLFCPDLSKYTAIFGGGLATTYILFPSRPNAMSWAILCLGILSTGICIVEYGENYFRYGITHSSLVASLMIFFAGFGASGAIVFSGACCVMWTMAAPSSIMALNIGVACVAQMVMCVLLEVSLLHQIGEAQKCVDEMKAVEEQKANFMAIVSHELRSPLHGIIGLTSSLIANRVPQDASRTWEKHLKLVLNCAHRQLDMVNNIMDASMLVQEKRAMFSRDLVRLDSLVGEVISSSQHLVDRSGKKLLKDGVRLVNMLGTLPEIEADLQRCTQLVCNLISNALKFTERGHVAVHGGADEESRTVRLTVEDTGVGIASESLETIFRPFSQEDESPERLYDGLGLGLSICKAVVAEHGGSLTVESTKGEGSKFHIVLPYSMKDRTAVPSSAVNPVGAAKLVSGGPSSCSTCGSLPAPPAPAAPRKELRKVPSGESSCRSDSSFLLPKSRSLTLDSECGQNVRCNSACSVTTDEGAVAGSRGPSNNSLYDGPGGSGPGEAHRSAPQCSPPPYQMPPGNGPASPWEPASLLDSPPAAHRSPSPGCFSFTACSSGRMQQQSPEFGASWQASPIAGHHGGLPEDFHRPPDVREPAFQALTALSSDTASRSQHLSPLGPQQHDLSTSSQHLRSLSSDAASRSQHLSRTPSATTFSTFLSTPTMTQESLYPLQFDTCSRDDLASPAAFAYPVDMTRSPLPASVPTSSPSMPTAPGAAPRRPTSPPDPGGGPDDPGSGAGPVAGGAPPSARAKRSSIRPPQGVNGCSWWELRRQTAHQCLHIRHRWRDQAMMQVAIQQTFLLLHMLEKHPHLGNQVESRAYFLDEIQKRVTHQLAHLDQMRHDLAMSQEAIKNRMIIIQNLKANQEGLWWGYDHESKPFEELEEQIMRCTFELREQEKDMDKVEEELVHQHAMLVQKLKEDRL